MHTYFLTHFYHFIIPKKWTGENSSLLVFAEFSSLVVLNIRHNRKKSDAVAIITFFVYFVEPSIATGAAAVVRLCAETVCKRSIIARS